MLIFDELQPPFDEDCEQDELAPDFRTPPIELTLNRYVVSGGVGTPTVHHPPSGWRLLPEFRELAELPVREMLERAAARRYRVVTEDEHDDVTATSADAMAQLAVTGRRAYTEFSVREPQDDDLIGRTRERLRDELDGEVDGPELERSVRYVLDLAYRTAWAIRGGPADRRSLRGELGWVATCSEADSPHRPVNVPSARWPQHDMTVTVNGTTLVCRYFIAASESAPQGSRWADGGRRSVPEDPGPWLPEEDRVVLFIHGHGSRAEEAAELVPWIHRVAEERGERIAVVSMDLPCRGYSSMLDHETVAPFPSTFGHRVPHRPPGLRYPILEFYEEFLGAFLEELSRQVGRPLDDVTVVGGSLGGNLSLRLDNPVLRGNLSGATRPLNRWIRRHVAWSPASVWASFGVGNDFFKDESIRQTRDNSRAAEVPEDRRKFFDEVFFAKPGGALNDVMEVVTFSDFNLPAPSETWYSDEWGCKAVAIQGGVRDIAEVYCEQYRRWHWRVAFEQLLFSHRDTVPGGSGALYSRMDRPLLLLSGKHDSYDFAHIFDRSRDMARDLSALPGRGVFLEHTGHSIHVERPRFLGTQIVDFVTDTPTSP